MKRLTIAVILIAGGTLGAAADTIHHVFKDVLKPQGHERSVEAKDADGRACGAMADRELPADIRGFTKCMRAHGWALARIERERSPVSAQSGPQACTAKVLQMEDTNIGLNHGALAKMVLRVTPPGGRAFTTTVWKEVSLDVPPRAGSTLRVTCDPANPTDIHPAD